METLPSVLMAVREGCKFFSRGLKKKAASKMHLTPNGCIAPPVLAGFHI
jgi:hypothetical protein